MHPDWCHVIAKGLSGKGIIPSLWFDRIYT